jgi:hypothetical protein
MNVDFATVWTVVEKGGTGLVILILGYLVYALLQGKVVPRWVYDNTKNECDVFRQIAFRNLELAEETVKVAERTTPKVGLMNVSRGE